MNVDRNNLGNTSEVAQHIAGRAIDSRRLLYFYHVAQSGSFSAAETALDIAQSALSRQIRRLEADLDTQLLERRGHGVELTATGLVLYEYAAEILDLMLTAVEEVDKAKHSPRGSISLAVSRPFSTTYVPDILSEFMSKHPLTQVIVNEASSGQVYELLTSGAVDLAVVLAQANSPKIVTTKLFDEELFLTGASDHPLLQHEVIDRDLLREVDLILPAAQFGTRSLIEGYVESGGFDVNSSLRFDSVTLMVDMIQRTEKCALLPKAACEAELRSGKLIARPLRPSLTRTLRIAHLRDEKRSNELVALRKTILDVVRHATPVDSR